MTRSGLKQVHTEAENPTVRLDSKLKTASPGERPAFINFKEALERGLRSKEPA